MIKIEEARKQINPKTFVELYANENNLINKQELNKIVSLGKKIGNYIFHHPKSITLLVGQVQAGKTAIYLSIIANLMDMGSNFFIITPAIDNILLNQTFSRIKKIFSKKTSVYDIRQLFSNKKIQAEKLINDLMKNKKPIILISLKNKKRLEQTYKIVKIVEKYIKKPIFIDDEGDQASFDNINIEEQTSINKAVLKIFDYHKEIRMITVTASPMPQILIQNKNILKPDVAFNIKPGGEYVGLNYFNSENASINEINERDRDIISGKIKGILPKSYKNSIISFFTRAAYLHLINKKIETQSMLVHIEKQIKHHVKIEEKTTTFIENDLLPNLSRRKKYISVILDNIYKFSKDFFEKNNFDEFIDLVIDHINFSSIILINSKSSDVPILHNFQEKNYILIGSSMLQRGITIKNLVVTYFAYRKAGTLNADTVLQRARWFGYRKHANLIDLWLTKTAAIDFKSLGIMTQNMIDNIDYFESENISFKEYKRSIFLPSANLKGTRDSVIKNRRSMLSRYMTNFSTKSSIIAEELWTKVSKLDLEIAIQNQNFQGKWFNNFDDFVFWIGKEKIEQIFDSINIFDYDRKTFEDFIKIENPKFYIVNMYSKNKNGIRYRSFNGGLISISEGQNPNYVGDRYWFKDKSKKFVNTIILQIHCFVDNQNINKEKINEKIYKISLVSTNGIYGNLVHAID